MANWIIKETVDLQKRPSAAYVGGTNALMIPGDNLAHTWEVTVLDGGEPAEITGNVVGWFLREDGNVVMVQGTVADNICRVTLTQECYAISGVLQAAMRVMDGTSNATVTIAAQVFTVRKSMDDGGTIDPGEIIPDISELLAKIAEMEQATADAEAAADAVPDMVAPVFSTSTAYSAGSYIYYDGTLYRFTADHAAGAWNSAQAVAVTVGGEVADLKSALSDAPGLTNAVREALLACFEHVAWIDDHGIDYYNALENALYPLASISVVYTQSGQVYATDLLDSLKSDLVVTAINHDSSQYIVPASEYTLSGTLVAGTSTITVTYKGKTATFAVNVTDLRLVYEINPGTDLTGRAIDTGVPVFGKNASFTILANANLAVVQSNKAMAYLLNHKALYTGTIRLGFDNVNNLLHFVTNVMYSDYYAENYTPGDISPSVTHNVVWIVRMDNQYVRKILYVDNNKLVDRSESVSSYVDEREFTGNYLVGGYFNTTNLNYTWPGSVNLFRIYNEALDISEIESIMNLTL